MGPQPSAHDKPILFKQLAFSRAQPKIGHTSFWGPKQRNHLGIGRRGEFLPKLRIGGLIGYSLQTTGPVAITFFKFIDRQGAESVKGVA